MSSEPRKLKICHVITRMIVGGAQENTLLTCLGHLRKGHEVVLVTGPSPGREGRLLAHVDFPEFEIVEMPELVRELNPVRDLEAYGRLKRFFRERNFDVVHTHRRSTRMKRGGGTPSTSSPNGWPRNSATRFTRSRRR